MSHLKNSNSLVINLFLMFISIVILFVFLEFVFFRVVFKASDYPLIKEGQKVVRYKASQQGIYRVRFEIEAPFRVNEAGWNSGHKQYLAKSDSVRRIAVIGDSYVEAFQVSYKSSFAERLQAELGDKSEVYRFGISGAPLSQYLWMLEHEVLQYSPDVVVVNMVHNDFRESWSSQGGEYSSSFMKLLISEDESVRELSPQPYKPGKLSFIRQMAWYRFTAFRFQASPGALIRSLFDRENEAIANVSRIDLKQNRVTNASVTDHVFSRIKSSASLHGFKVVLLMDGVRELVEGKISESAAIEALWLNQMVTQKARKYDLNLIDLHPVFTENYRVHQSTFQFKSDAHWNRQAHELVAKVLSDAVSKL